MTSSEKIETLRLVMKVVEIWLKQTGRDSSTCIPESARKTLLILFPNGIDN